MRSDQYSKYRRNLSDTIYVLGLYFHSRVLKPFHNGSGVIKMKYFGLFGWLLPLAITIIWIVANLKYGDKESICWRSSLSKFTDINHITIYR